MLYPNRIQTALLFDRHLNDLESMMRDYQRIEGIRSGAQFNLSEVNPGRFYRLFNGAEELMVTFEYCDHPAKAELFTPALSSAFTGIACPDIRQRIARSSSHILLEVSHGVFAGAEEDPKIAAMFDAIGRPKSGATQTQFERRLAVLALMARVVTEHAMPAAVHWTQSDMLLSGEIFDSLAAPGDLPGPLNIHPFLFGPRPAPGDDALVGIRTFGARHWLGREVIIQPHVLPWADNLETIFAFLKLATMPNGYVIPHGDTFGPEDRSLSYRVLHHDQGATIGDDDRADVPLFELVPLKHVANAFVARDHVPDANVIDDRTFPVRLMPEDEEAKMELANEWAEKRKLAEGVGGQFEVRYRDVTSETPPPSPQPPAPTPPGQPASPRPPLRGPGARVFGRKGL